MSMRPAVSEVCCKAVASAFGHDSAISRHIGSNRARCRDNSSTAIPYQQDARMPGYAGASDEASLTNWRSRTGRTFPIIWPGDWFKTPL
jgi:hypothetical protein